MKKQSFLTTITLSVILFLNASCQKKCDCKNIEFNKDKIIVSKEEPNKPYSGICNNVWGSGKISTKIQFDNGVIVSKNWWYENGQLSTEQKFNKMGILVSIKSFYEDGKLLGDITFDNSENWNNNIKVRNKYPYGFDYLLGYDFSDTFKDEIKSIYNYTTVGSKIYWNDGKLFFEKIKPIEFTTECNNKEFIDGIFYSNEGHIRVIHGYFGKGQYGSEYYFHIITGKDKSFCSTLFKSIDQTKDINKVITVLKMKQVDRSGYKYEDISHNRPSYREGDLTKDEYPFFIPSDCDN